LKLHLAQNANQNLITGYGAGYVAINGQRYEQNLIVTPSEIVKDWPAKTDIDEVALNMVLHLAPQIVLIGTGKSIHFPKAEVLKGLIAARIGYEIMDTPAACRTYNILIAEGRKVAAALVVSL
jgi:uncharacterized protein